MSTTSNRKLTMRRYAIVGVRPTGEALYYCDHATQGERFVPNAYDMAYLFSDSDAAHLTLSRMQKQFAGLALLIENRSIPCA